MSSQYNCNESQSQPARTSLPAAPRAESPSPLGILIAFPPEIRQLIYPYALAQSPALIRTSKAIRAETQPLLYQHGVYRVYINIDHDEPWPVQWCDNQVPQNFQSAYVTVRPHSLWKSSHDSLVNIRNFEIHVDISEPGQSDRGINGGKVNPLSSFSDVAEMIYFKARKPWRCRVKFTYGKCYELFHGKDFNMMHAIMFLAESEDLEIDLCQRPWVHEYPHYFASESGRSAGVYSARTEEQAVEVLKIFLWQPIEAGKKIRIVKSSVDAGREVEIFRSNSQDCEHNRQLRT